MAAERGVLQEGVDRREHVRGDHVALLPLVGGKRLLAFTRVEQKAQVVTCRTLPLSHGRSHRELEPRPWAARVGGRVHDEARPVIRYIRYIRYSRVHDDEFTMMS